MSGSISSAGRLGGVGSMHVNGTPYMLVELTWSPSVLERESLVGMDSYHGYSEKHRPGSIQARLRDNGSLSVGAINDWTSVDVVLQLANGKVVYGYAMVAINAQEVNAMDGIFEVRLEGPRVLEG